MTKKQPAKKKAPAKRPAKQRKHPLKGKTHEDKGTGTELSPWKGNGGARAGAGRPPGSVKRIATMVDRMKLAESARKITPRLLVVLRQIVMGKVDGVEVSHRLKAIEILLDRGYGRAPQGHPIPEQAQGIVGLTITQDMLDKLDDKQQAALENILLILAGDDSVSASRADASQVGEERFAAAAGYLDLEPE